jgi:hypothetical protein
MLDLTLTDENDQALVRLHYDGVELDTELRGDATAAKARCPESCRRPATLDGREAPPTRPLRPTAELRIPVVWPRTSGVRCAAAR